jgi:hypothetical protein
MTSVLRSLFLTFRTAAWSRAALQLEILALRHQLEVLQRTRPRRVRLAKMDRWLWVLLARLWTGWRTALVIVKPETVIAWHRRGFRSFLTTSGDDLQENIRIRQPVRWHGHGGSPDGICRFGSRIDFLVGTTSPRNSRSPKESAARHAMARSASKPSK